MEAKNPEEKYIFQKTDLKKFLFTGIVGMVGYHIFFFLSLKYTTAINSSIIGGDQSGSDGFAGTGFSETKAAAEAGPGYRSIALWRGADHHCRRFVGTGCL